MKELKLKINCDNDAFHDAPEVEIARVLRKIAQDIEDLEATGMYQNIKDINGNIIGTFRLTGV